MRNSVTLAACALCVSAVFLVGAPAPAAGQSLSVHRGRLLNSDGDLESMHPTFGFRVDHAFNRWVLLEAGAQYAPLELTDFRDYGNTSVREAAPRWAADLVLQAQVWLGPLRPYLGLGRGAFTYRRLAESMTDDRARIVGRTGLISAGVRVDLPRRLGARGEVRVRRDSPSYSYLGIDSEWALGLSYRW